MHNFPFIISGYKFPNIELTQIMHVRVGTEWDYSLCDNFNRLYFVLDGEGVIHTQTETVILKPWHIYVIPSMLAFECKCHTFLEKLYAHFKVTILPNRDLLSKLDKIVEIESSREELMQLKAVLYEESMQSIMLFRIKLEQLVMKLIQPLEEEYSHDFSLYLKFEQFFFYTTNHQYADLTIDEICKNIGMTPRQLTYRYKAATGQTVKSYLNSLLLERSKFLLNTTDRPIRSISAELHFGNEFYFSRFFKKHEGLSPRNYRKRKT